MCDNTNRCVLINWLFSKKNCVLPFIHTQCNILFLHSSQGDTSSNERMWIEKPSGGQHGVGMHVHQGCEKLRQKYGKCQPTESRPHKFFIMEYIDPALLGGHKFDVRSYLVVVSLDPLIVFYHDGFVRRATR
jgi:hypothetical protein